MIWILKILADLDGSKPVKDGISTIQLINDVYLQIGLVELDSQVYRMLVCSAVRSVIYQGFYRSPDREK